MAPSSPSRMQMHWLPLLLAVEEQGGFEAFFRSPMFPIMIMVGVMVIFSMRNGAKQRREAQDMLAKLKKNDKVYTSAGIVGIVVAIKENEDELTLRVDETTGSRIRVLRSSIARVV